MIEKSELRDDLDKVHLKTTPRTARIAVDHPKLKFKLFNPTTDLNPDYFSKITRSTSKKANLFNDPSIPTKLPGYLSATAALVFNQTTIKIKYGVLGDLQYEATRVSADGFVVYDDEESHYLDNF